MKRGSLACQRVLSWAWPLGEQEYGAPGSSTGKGESMNTSENLRFPKDQITRASNPWSKKIA